MIKSLLVFLLLIPYFLLHAQKAETPTFRLFLIGDAGEGDTTGATLHDLKVMLQKSSNSAVVFLGDNCYVKSIHGLLKLEVGGYDGSKTGQRRLMSQLDVLRGYKGSAYFIPGNHDWYNHIDLKKGKRRLLAEQKFIEDTLKTFTSIVNHDKDVFIPKEGNPGPISHEYNDGKTRIIFIDSYRIIIEEGRRHHIDTLILNNFYNALSAQLADAKSKHQKIIVVAHHPIHAKGKHSLPLIFWERLNRRFADANTNYPPYKKMADHLDSLLKAQHYTDLYYVSGHEHSLEYFYNDSIHYLVSGAGSRVDQVTTKDLPENMDYYIWNQEGFYEIVFYGKYEQVLMYHRKDAAEKLQVHCLTGCD